MDAGHLWQNLYLQAEARGLATVSIGAFRDREVCAVLGVADDHRPFSLFPVGMRREGT